MGRNLILGDIHGSYRRLMDVLEQASFSEDDNLYATGDLVDRGEEPLEVLRFLRGLRNFYPVLGNHDVWLQNYAHDETVDPLWLKNDGWNTLLKMAEAGVTKEELQEIDLWLQSFPYIRILDKAIIVHAGLERKAMPLAYYEAIAAIKRTSPETMFHCIQVEGEERKADLVSLLWDRGFVREAFRRENPTRFQVPDGKTLFLGHTPMSRPRRSRDGSIINVDTGAFASGGALTLMNMDTLRYWESKR